jgi:hypothetical protein
MRARAPIILAAAALLLAAPLAAKEKDPAAVPKRSPALAVAFSLALPGGGQLYTANYLKAGAFAGGIGYLGYRYLDEDRKVRAAVTYEDWDHHYERRRLYQWWGVGVWIFSLADAYVDAHLYKFDDQSEPGVALVPCPGGLALAGRF